MPNFPRGAICTPRHKLSRAQCHQTRPALPTTLSYVPKGRSMYLNDQRGVCVSSESCFNIAVKTKPEIIISDKTLAAFTDKYQLNDGAELTQVMDIMIKDGMPDEPDNYDFFEGAYTAVDWSDYDNMASALQLGPIKIAIDSSVIDGGWGEKDGGYVVGLNRKHRNYDHCVCICGYGTAADLFKALNLPVPSKVSPTTKGYLLYSWSTIGFVDAESLPYFTAEAWIRNPSSIQKKINPDPTPDPEPNPDPVPWKQLLIQLVKLLTQLIELWNKKHK